jgi:hypothetical protein
MGLLRTLSSFDVNALGSTDGCTLKTDPFPAVSTTSWDLFECAEGRRWLVRASSRRTASEVASMDDVLSGEDDGEKSASSFGLGGKRS